MLDSAPKRSADDAVRNFILILLAVAAVLAASELLVRFHDWNRQQACVTGGGRNCGAPRTFLNR